MGELSCYGRIPKIKTSARVDKMVYFTEEMVRITTIDAFLVGNLTGLFIFYLVYKAIRRFQKDKMRELGLKVKFVKGNGKDKTFNELIHENL